MCNLKRFRYKQVLELRKNAIEQAKSNFQTSSAIAPHNFEAFFNAGKYRFVLHAIYMHEVSLMLLLAIVFHLNSSTSLIQTR